MQPDKTPAAFLLFIPPVINIASFLSVKLIADGIFDGYGTCYILYIFKIII